MKRATIFTIVGIILLSMILTGCKIKPTAAPRNTSIVIRATSVDDPGAGGTPDPTGEGGETEVVGIVVPADIPLPDGIYNLVVMREGTQIEFRIDGNMEDVHAYFAEELPKYGWEETRTPDSVVGSMGSMVRENANGDRLSVDMQFNQIGDFVVIKIAISRK